ncbi:hypothetical protein BHE74_00039165, partial [Ensete ventricosum]
MYLYVNIKVCRTTLGIVWEKKSPAGYGSRGKKSPVADELRGRRAAPDSRFFFSIFFFSLFFFLPPSTDTVENQLLTIKIDRYRPISASDVRPRTERYVSVRQLTSTWIARYRAAPSKSTVGDRFRSTVVIDFDRPSAADRGRNKEKEKKKKKKRNIPSLVPYGVRRLRDSSLAGDSFSPRGEKDRGD